MSTVIPTQRPIGHHGYWSYYDTSKITYDQALNERTTYWDTDWATFWDTTQLTLRGSFSYYYTTWGTYVFTPVQTSRTTQWYSYYNSHLTYWQTYNWTK